MIEINIIQEKLKNTLSEKRYKHSLGVADEAVKLAKLYGADVEKAYVAGLVHDCAKEIKTEAAVKMLKEDYNIIPEESFLYVPRLLHGLLGSCIARSEFGINDEEIIDAVRYHTTGKADMSLLTGIVYIADYIEPGRSYNDVDVLRKITYKNLEEGILYSSDYTICDLVKKGIVIHPDTMYCRNYLIKKGIVNKYGKNPA